MRFKKLLRLLIGFLLIVAMTFEAYRYFKSLSQKEEEGAFSSPKNTEKEESETAPLPVKVSTAKMGEIVLKLNTIGGVEAVKIVKVKADLKGDIKKLHVDEGKHVKEGEILAELDDTEYRLRLEEAEVNRLQKLSEFYVKSQSEELIISPAPQDSSNFEQKKREYEKALQLWKEGLISEKDFERAKRDYEISVIVKGEKREDVLSATLGFSQADIAYKQAKLNLEKTKIKTPFSGIVTDIKVKEGQSVNMGEELMTLVDIDRLRVKAKVLESEVGKLAIGRKATLKFSSYPVRIFSGTVKAISPIVDPSEKTCNVLIDLENPGKLLKPGMHCEVAIDAEMYRGKLIVPKESILVRGGRKLCFVVEGELAKWRYVDTGLEDDENVEILNGVSEGEKVITEGHFTLAHDARVRIVE